MLSLNHPTLYYKVEDDSAFISDIFTEALKTVKRWNTAARKEGLLPEESEGAILEFELHGVTIQVDERSSSDRVIREWRNAFEESSRDLALNSRVVGP